MVLNMLKILISIVFFVFYYIIMELILHISIFEAPYHLLTIYFLAASLTFPYTEEKINEYLNNKSNLFIPPANIIMPLAYVVSPIYALIHIIYRQFEKAKEVSK